MSKPLLIAVVVIAVVSISVLAVPMLGLTQTIAQYADTLRSGDPDVIARYYLLLLLLYFVVYTASVALCLPLTALMAALGGWLFGLWSLPVALLSVLAGSIAPFLLSRRYAGRALARIDSATIDRIRRGFERNQIQFMIVMRLVPWAPFTVTTIVAGALRMDLTKFLIGTGLGFLPTGLAFNAIGHGLARLSDFGGIAPAQLYRDPDFLIALAGVGGVVLLSLSRRIPFVAKLFA